MRAICHGARDRDPYRVWLSEIMLQQTRVAAVIEHYHEFLRRFPTVREAGGGARSVSAGGLERLGILPPSPHAACGRESDRAGTRRASFRRPPAALRALPGIGRYTAAAIASIAFEQPVAVVDGNVERVLQRILRHAARTGEEIWKAAEDLLDRQRPGDFNQAMMELGATVCTPRAPSCLTCPVVDCAPPAESCPACANAQSRKNARFITPWIAATAQCIWCSVPGMRS